MNPKDRLNKLLDAEVDRRFEMEILDRLRGKRLSPLAQKSEKKEEQGEEGLSEEDLTILQALDAGEGDNNAAA